MPVRRDTFADRQEALARGYEFEDPSVKGIFLVIGLLLGMVAIVLAVVAGGYRFLSGTQANEIPVSKVPLRAGETFPGPRLQIDPQQEYRRLYERQHQELESYGWVDDSRGLVRIPIDRAMERILERNELPVRGTETEREPRLTPLELQRRRAERGSPGTQD